MRDKTFNQSPPKKKVIPDCFYLPYSDVCKTNRKFRNNVCSYQPSHKVSLSFVNCRNVYIAYYCSYEHNPKCSRDYVKNNTIPSNDCQKIFLKTSLSRRCLSCYDLILQKIEKYNPKELGSLVNKNKKMN